MFLDEFFSSRASNLLIRLILIDYKLKSVLLFKENLCFFPLFRGEKKGIMS